MKDNPLRFQQVSVVIAVTVVGGMVSCERASDTKSVKAQDLATVDAQQETFDEWYRHQESAAHSINLLAEDGVNVELLRSMTPSEVLRDQHDAVGSITDITVQNDERWQHVERWLDAQMAAVACLERATTRGSSQPSKDRPRSIDLVFELQEALLTELEDRDSGVRPMSR
jgi:hypothetical protein